MRVLIGFLARADKYKNRWNTTARIIYWSYICKDELGLETEITRNTRAITVVEVGSSSTVGGGEGGE